MAPSIKKTPLLVIATLLFAATCWAQKPPIVEQMAKTYGLDSFGQIDAIRYTFNIPAFKLSRTWTWEPKADRVTYEGKDKDGKPVKVTYVRSQLGSQPDNVKKEIDPGFINDQYWLVLPFHIAWDSASVEDKGMQKVPGGKVSARHVVVKYSSDVGYTPGDTWELYVGSDNRIQKMVFHHGGTVKPSLVDVTWESYKKAGPLLFSMDHHGTADGHPVQIFFTDIAVKVAGSDNWVNAQ
ncbi:MAG TPA: hypothetical protein VFQ41_21125 [Candidatus Angelobacter sp.]|nr:hypothetical protein [Candidatus Angelobacter sp.]